MTSIRLRAARPTDAEHVWTWNAADDVRALSNDCRPIPLDEHLAWYARRIASPDPMWIVEEDGDPIGVVRIDNRGGEGRISIALPAHARGRQIGRRAIEAACRAYGTPVIAEIHRSNHPSRAAFEACGFQLVGVDADRSLYRWTPEIV